MSKWRVEIDPRNIQVFDLMGGNFFALLRRFDAEATLAQIQVRFGEIDSAIAALPHLLEVPAGITRAELRLDPYWDPLRKDPRFLITDGEGAMSAKPKP